MVRYVIKIWDEKNKIWYTRAVEKTQKKALKLAEMYRHDGEQEIMIKKVSKNGKVIDAYPV